MTGQVVPANPAASVRGPTHVVRTGKTPVLQPAEARLLLDTIDTSTVRWLRDRALLAVMVYSFISSVSCRRMYSRMTSSAKPTVLTQYPFAQKW